jgi:hypothetical protein
MDSTQAPASYGYGVGVVSGELKFSASRAASSAARFFSIIRPIQIDAS